MEEAPNPQQKQKHNETSSLVPEQVAAHADDRVRGGVQTNVALERGPVPFALAAAASASARPVPVLAALSGGEAFSAGRPAVTRRAGIRGGHVC